MLIRLLLGSFTEIAVAMVTAGSLSLVCVTVQGRVCLFCMYATVFGRPLALCRQVGSEGSIPMLTDLTPVLLLSPPTDTVDIKTSKADLWSGSATS